MATHPNPSPLPAWAPQGIADWAPLAVSAGIILIMTTVLMTRVGGGAKPVPDGNAKERSVEGGSALPLLSSGTPALSTESAGSLRLVPTDRLPPAKQSVQTDAQCPRPTLPSLSAQAKVAITAGWHVSADTVVNGFQFVMVDAGVEKGSAGCAAIGGSALVFNAHGLIAIAYDRNAKQSSRLSSLTVPQPGVVQLLSLKGPLAELSVTDQQIGLRPLATSKRNRSSR
jgi:hypothetical protein